MLKEFKCWFPEQDESEEDARTFQEFDARGAACSAAEKDDPGDYWIIGKGGCEVMVKDMETGTVQRFDVTAEQEITYCASEAK